MGRIAVTTMSGTQQEVDLSEIKTFLDSTPIKHIGSLTTQYYVHLRVEEVGTISLEIPEEDVDKFKGKGIPVYCSNKTMSSFEELEGLIAHTASFFYMGRPNEWTRRDRCELEYPTSGVRVVPESRCFHVKDSKQINEGDPHIQSYKDQVMEALRESPRMADVYRALPSELASFLKRELGEEEEDPS